jgi:hypothetical protein
MLFLISVTSYVGQGDHLTVSAKTLSGGPNLSSGTHLKDDCIERPFRWAKHHVACSVVESPAMAGTFQTFTRCIEFHGTACMRTSATEGPVFAVARSEQHSRIVSGWKVEVEARTGQQCLGAL